jgi:hypothetical protein
MKTNCNHCNSVIPEDAAHEWRGWVDKVTKAHCDSVYIECPLCGFVSICSTSLQPETPSDREFFAFADEQHRLLVAGKPNVFTEALK